MTNTMRDELHEERSALIEAINDEAKAQFEIDRAKSMYETAVTDLETATEQMQLANEKKLTAEHTYTNKLLKLLKQA